MPLPVLCTHRRTATPSILRAAATSRADATTASVLGTMNTTNPTIVQTGSTLYCASRTVDHDDATIELATEPPPMTNSRLCPQIESFGDEVQDICPPYDHWAVGGVPSRRRPMRTTVTRSDRLCPGWLTTADDQRSGSAGSHRARYTPAAGWRIRCRRTRSKC